MSEITIRKIDKEHGSDARILNEPFKQWGRMIPRLEGGTAGNYGVVLS